jgi:hypothetical protein
MEPPAVPSGAASATLRGISCRAADTCVAVGWYTTAGSANKPLAYTLTP